MPAQILSSPSWSAWGGATDSPTCLVLLTSLVGIVVFLLLVQLSKSSRSLPPGPRGLPLIGDVRHIADHNWLASPERKNEYGEMMYINALGRGVLILNSQRVAVDLLEKRSSIYSDRPHYISGGDYMSENLAIGFMPYNDLWRRFRRASLDSFSKSASPRFYPIQHREAMMLAQALMSNPLDMDRHFRRHTSSIMLSINYHLPPVETEKDPVVLGIVDHARRLLHELRPGARLVEYFPWMRHFPGRLAKWKRHAQYWYIQDSLMFERLMKKVEDDLANGIDQPSLGATLIKNQSQHNLSERERAWLAGEMFSAGVETTSTTLSWWLLTMLAYPEVQARAHAELDEVVGRARPPTFADVPSLPYIRAMVRETLRRWLILPLGIPHVSTEDDWYEGMFIPKGTICFPNMRVLNFEPEVFGEDAGVRFEPSRHLDEKTGELKVLMEGHEEGHMTFGFGRRLCIGKYVAENTLAIDFAVLLWAMRFEHVDGSGDELDMETLVHSGITARPVPFKCRAIPRFPEVETLLSEALELYQ
ncbi:cytochrome P450 [Multifurca ochricompacta]|uniref:Cytochrome P450 n=1 Tax=Multifurca ochricompacta TaxID=376703 RepID=A0AAD4M5B2_9AGAM|nr:cytochrome P450 [Multifurca ochricompacta]